MFDKVIKKVTSTVVDNKNEILIGAGVASLITSTVLAVKATPKALNSIDDEKDELSVSELTRKDVVKVAWKHYIPSALCAIAGTSAIIAGATMNKRKSAALTALYSVTNQTFQEYRTQTKQMVGDEKARELDKRTTERVVRNRESQYIINDVDYNDFIDKTGNGTTIIKDEITGKVFMSSTRAVEKAIVKANRKIFTEGYITLNEWYSELDVQGVPILDFFGWDANKTDLDIDFYGDTTPNGEPMLVMWYKNPPQIVNNR